MNSTLTPPDLPPPPIPPKSPDRNSAPERLETASQDSTSDHTANQEPEIQGPPSQSSEEEHETNQQLVFQDPQQLPSSSQQLATYIHNLQHQHHQKIAFLQRDLHLEKSKRIHLIAEKDQERTFLYSKILDLTHQLSVAEFQIPGTFENKCTNLSQLRAAFPEIGMAELGILVCETYSTIDLLNLLNIDGMGSSSEPVGNIKKYGSDSRIWSKMFLKYIEVLCCIYSMAYPELIGALLRFHREILGLAEGYSWREKVLPLAIFHHGMVKKEGVVRAENWVIPEETRERFCPRRKGGEGEDVGDGESVREKGRLRALSDKFRDKELRRGYTSLKERYIGGKLGSVLGAGNESKVTLAESVKEGKRG